MDIIDIEDLNGNFTSLDCIEHDVKALSECMEKPTHSELIKQIMPQHPERLFSQILYSNDMDNVIFNWQNEFHLTKELAIHDLYQLYVDICTYQHINVKTFLEVQENDLNDLLPYMDNTRNSILSYTGKYFLSIRNKGHLKKVAKVEEFIEKFVAASFKAKIVYDNCLFKKLIKFFMLLCTSNKRPIRHTGVFLGVKHLTELIRVGAKICHKICSTKSALESVEDPEMIDQLNLKLENLKNFDDQVNSFISFLQCRIFKENVNYQEPSLHFMRHDLILELYKWIEIYPGRHLHNENLNYFVKAMTDRNKNVRGTAIDMIGKIIVNYETLVHAKLNKLMFPVAKQIEDVDSSVAIKAVDTLTIIQRYVPLPSIIREVLLKNIYNIHFPLAQASGRYLVALIRQKSDADDEDYLKHLLMFELKAVKRGLVERQPYLIESIYDYFPVLQDVKTFINLFQSVELNEEYKDIWLSLLTESVHITFTGKCSEKRNKQETRKIDKDVQKKMQNDLIKYLNLLSENWSKEKLVPLLELLKAKIREGKKKTTTNENVSENVTKRTTRSKNKTLAKANENNAADAAVEAETSAAEELIELVESPKKKQKLN